MNEKKVFLGTIGITVLLLIGGVTFLTKTDSSASKISASANVKVSLVDPVNFDWGTIPMDKGDATKAFIIKNTGTDILKLSNVRTSCHCTKAYVTINGTDSPSFGMDSLSSWVGEVTPGGQAKLTAIFDPAFHGPSGIGPVNRFVSVETNDSSHPKLTFSLTGTVVK